MIKRLRLLIMTILMTLCIYSIAGEYVISFDRLTELILTREIETSNRFGFESVREPKVDYDKLLEIVIVSMPINLITTQGTPTFGVGM